VLCEGSARLAQGVVDEDVGSRGVVPPPARGGVEDEPGQHRDGEEGVDEGDARGATRARGRPDALRAGQLPVAEARRGVVVDEPEWTGELHVETIELETGDCRTP
jgi:hypothetical protein